MTNDAMRNDAKTNDRTISGRTRVAGVIGWPVAHSLSPVIHAAGFASLGVDAVYVALPVPPGRGAEAVRGAFDLGFVGLSVTMPHKEAVAASVDEIEDTAAFLRSVNTVCFGAGGTVGRSTDGDGFLASLRDEAVHVSGRSALVIGTGGAGRAVAEALNRAGARLTVSNRSEASARHLAELLPGCSVVSWSELGRVAPDHDLIVNCTSIGMGDSDESPLDVGRLSKRHVVVDIVYHPERTPLLIAAETRGATAVGGLGMLVHQAALQETAWFGASPDVTAMKESVRRALAAQG